MNITQKVKRLVLTLPLLLFFINPAFALEVQQYENLQDDKDGKDLVMIYIKALGEAYSFSNAAVIRRGDKPLFCPPGTIALNPENYTSIIEAQLARMSKGAKAELPIDLILYYGLVESFPCPNPK